MRNTPLVVAVPALWCALGCSALAGGSAPDVWSTVQTPSNPPAPFGGAVVANDAHGLVLIAGSPATPLAQSVWRFDGEQWTHLLDPAITTSPADLAKPTRFAAAGDTGRNYSLLFGGMVNGQYSANTIFFSGGHFSLFDDAEATRPSPRADASLAYFAEFDSLILFGGRGPDGLLNDTWSWGGEGWSLVPTPVSPSPRSGHAMAYDPGRHIIVLYGGATADGPNNETWTFDGKEWSLFTYRGPSPRSGQAMFFDEGRECVVLVGGLPQDPDVPVAETWEWTGSNWRLIESGGPTPRIGAKAAYDAQRGLAVLFGGVGPAANLLNDTWELQLSSPFGPGIETPAGLSPSDVTTGFFNADEFPDAVVTDTERASLFVFRNLGVGGFGVPRGAGDDWNGFDAPDELPLAGPPGKAEAVDINNDGKADLLVAIPSGGNGMAGSQFLLGNGSGGFGAATNLLDDFGQDDVQPGDLDNVKDLRGAATFVDLAYVSTSSGKVGVVEGAPGGFNPPLVLETGGEPTRVALGDLNFDGLADLVFTDRAAGTVAVILQSTGGKERFNVADRIDFPVGLPGGEPVALVLVDFDGDEDLDVATADSATDTVTALRNLGVDDGEWLGFEVSDITPAGENPVSIEAARFFGGFLPDLATANADGSSLSLLRNLGGGLFADPIDLSVIQGPIAVATADLNADGLDDLVAASAPPSPPGILTTFLALGLTPCPGDVDGDRTVGFVDLMLLLNQFGQSSAERGGDFDGDGVVDFTDLNTLLSNFGISCP